MIKLHSLGLITFFSVSIVPFMQGDSATDMFKQGWESTKQKAKEVGAKMVDAFDIKKYNKLLKEAEDGLDNCVKTKNVCTDEHAQYEKLKKRQRSEFAFMQAKGDYMRCAKRNCSEQYDQLMKARRAQASRGLAIGLTVGLGSAALAGGAMIGTAAAISVMEISENQKKELEKKVAEYINMYELSEDQTKYLVKIIAMKEYGKEYDLPFVKKVIIDYLRNNKSVEKLVGDALIQAIQGYTGFSMEQLIGKTMINPFFRQ